MIRGMRARGFAVTGVCAALTLSGCSFQGVNSLPLPGAVGRGSDAVTYNVEVPNVATLEPNSPVMIDDVIVGSVRKMTVDNWHANVEISVKPDVVIPANAVASVGQTSLLGSMHLALNPPLGEAPSADRLPPGSTVGLNDTTIYPSTERTLSSLSAIVNGGGLGQIGTVIHNFSTAVSGRETEIRELLMRLDDFVGTLDEQRDNIIASIEQMNRVASTFAQQTDTIRAALKDIPPAVDVLIEQRPNLTTALDKLGVFSQTATELVDEAGDELATDLKNLEPILKALNDVGPDLNKAVLWALAFPYGPTFADRITKGDYINLFATFDLTYPRIKRTMLLGTRWGDENARLIPAPGDPYYLNYSYDPMLMGVAPPPNEPPTGEGAPAGAVAPAPPPVIGPLLPVSPPPPAMPWQQNAELASGQIFAGPYAGAPAVAPQAVAPPGEVPPGEVPPAPGGGS